MNKLITIALALIISVPTFALSQREIDQMRERAKAQIESQQSFVQAAIKQQSTLKSSEGYQLQSQFADKLATKMADQSRKTQYLPHMFVAVTLSMPKEALRTILIQAHKMNMPVILNGMIDNSMAKTSQFIQDILLKDLPKPIQGGFSFDPMLFAKYKIKNVPAYIAVGKPCKEESKVCDRDGYDEVIGNLTPLAAAKEIVKKGKVGIQSAQKALDNYAVNKGERHA